MGMRRRTSAFVWIASGIIRLDARFTLARTKIIAEALTILRSRENPKIGWRVDPDLSGVSEVRSFRVLTWTEYTMMAAALKIVLIKLSKNPLKS